MYTRRYYRKPPPGYSGVAFSAKREMPSVKEEKGVLDAVQAGQHQRELGRTAREETVFDGQKLAPILGGEEGGVVFEKEAIPTSAPAESPGRKGDSDELILVGVILFLLGSGLDEQSILILLCMLILLT